MPDTPTPLARLNGKVNEIRTTLDRRLIEVGQTLTDYAKLEEVGTALDQKVTEIEQTLTDFGKEIDEILDESLVDAYQSMEKPSEDEKGT